MSCEDAGKESPPLAMPSDGIVSYADTQTSSSSVDDKQKKRRSNKQKRSPQKSSCGIDGNSSHPLSADVQLMRQLQLAKQEDNAGLTSAGGETSSRRERRIDRGERRKTTKERSPRSSKKKNKSASDIDFDIDFDWWNLNDNCDYDTLGRPTDTKIGPLPRVSRRSKSDGAFTKIGRAHV